jgi:hypothetical protein
VGASSCQWLGVVEASTSRENMGGHALEGGSGYCEVFEGKPGEKEMSILGYLAGAG